MDRRDFLLQATIAGLGLLTGCRRRPPLPGLSTPALDIHIHAAALGNQVEGAYVSDSFRRSNTFKIYMWAAGVSEKDMAGNDGTSAYIRNLLAQLRGAPSLNQAVILAMDQIYDPRGKPDRARTPYYVPNDFVIDLAHRHQELLAGVSIHPDRPGAVEEVTRLANRGAVLIKWLPNTQNIDVSAKRHRPLYRAMARNKLPLLVHMGTEHAVDVVDQALADPVTLRTPLEEGVTVICAHCASQGSSQGEHNLDRWLKLLPSYPNLYGDLSALTQLNRKASFERLLDRGDLWHRLVHGSDYPLPFFPLSSPYYFAGRIPRSQLDALQAIPNRLEREIRLKLALGVPERVFEQTRSLLT